MSNSDGSRGSGDSREAPVGAGVATEVALEEAGGGSAAGQGRDLKEWMMRTLPFESEVTERYVAGMAANGVGSWEVARWQTIGTLGSFKDGRGLLFLQGHVPAVVGMIQAEVDRDEAAKVAIGGRTVAVDAAMEVENWKLERTESAKQLPALPTVVKGRFTRDGVEVFMVKLRNAVGLVKGSGEVMSQCLQQVADSPTMATVEAVRLASGVQDTEERRLGSQVLAQASDEVSNMLGLEVIRDGRLLTVAQALSQSVYLGPQRELEEAWGALHVPPPAGRYITEEWRRSFQQVVDRLTRLLPRGGGVEASQLARAVKLATVEATDYRKAVAMEELTLLGGDSMGYDRLWELAAAEARVRKMAASSSNPNPNPNPKRHNAFLAGTGEEKVALPAPRAAGLVTCRDWTGGKCTYGDKCRFSHQGPGGSKAKAQVAMVAAAAGDAPAGGGTAEGRAIVEALIKALGVYSARRAAGDAKRTFVPVDSQMIIDSDSENENDSCGNQDETQDEHPITEVGGEHKGVEHANVTVKSKIEGTDIHDSPGEESHGIFKPANDDVVDTKLICDLGATTSVIGAPHMDQATEITVLDTAVKLSTTNSTVSVERSGDLIIETASQRSGEKPQNFSMKSALMVPTCGMSLASVSDVMKKGWSWIGCNERVTLIEPVGAQEVVDHTFRYQDGLYRFSGTAKRKKGETRRERRLRVENRTSVLSAEKDIASAQHSIMEKDAEWAFSADAATTEVSRQGSARKGRNLVAVLALMGLLSAVGGLGGAAAAGIGGAVMAKSVAAESKVQEKTSKAVRRKRATVTFEEHRARGHVPHWQEFCEACKRARMRASPAFSTSDPRKIQGAEAGYVIGLDIVGPFAPDVDGNVWGLVAVEVAHTDYGMVRLLKTRDAASVLAAFKDMERELKVKAGPLAKEIARVHTDRDGSFEKEFEEHLREKLVAQTDTGAYRPKSNGRVERRIGLLTSAMRAVVWDATAGLKDYQSLWGPAMVIANAAVNREGFEDGRSPVLQLTGAEATREDNVHAFGQRVRVHRVRELRTSKVDTPGDDKYLYVGPSQLTKGGVVAVKIEWLAEESRWLLGGTEEFKDGDVIEGDFPLKAAGDATGQTAEMEEFLTRYNLPSYWIGGDPEKYRDSEGRDQLYPIKAVTGVRGRGSKKQYEVEWQGYPRSTWEPIANLIKYGGAESVESYEAKRSEATKQAAARKRKAAGIKKGGKGFVSSKKQARRAKVGTRSKAIAMMAALGVDEIEIDRRAVAHLMRRQKRAGTVDAWLPGYRTELAEVKRRRLRKVTDYEEVNKAMEEAIGLRMLLEPKGDGRLKGRLICLGYQEPYWWDKGSTDSPVASMATVRTLLFRNGDAEDVVSSVDVATAFLQAEEYGPGERKRYVKYKPHPKAEVEYYGLLGPIYGQRSASKAWYKTLASWLTSKEQGYCQGDNEPCLFKKGNLQLVIYVDDIIARGPRAETEAFYRELEKKFKIKDPTILTDEVALRFLGFDIKKDGERYSIDQEDAIEKFLISAEVVDKRVESPMPTAKLLYEDDNELGEEQAQQYRSRVGSLNYFSSASRYDIALATSRLSQKAHKPTVSAWRAMERVLQYMQCNPHVVISGVRGQGKDVMETYSDSDHGGDKPHVMRSQTGSLILLNGVPVYWCSKKQTDTTAYSSTMAEIFALSETVRSARLFAFRAQEMGLDITFPLNIKIDSTGARSFQRGSCVQSRTAGVVDYRDEWVKELRDQDNIETEFVTSENNLADLFTKCFPTYKFKRLMFQIGDKSSGRIGTENAFMAYMEKEYCE